ncbi:reverse transcriptase domain-containing protein [Tanacetum coccineum]
MKLLHHLKTSSLVDDDLDEEKEAKPKNVNEALKDKSWIIAMQEELNQFIANDVWELVPYPKSTKIIGTKWVYRNKLDENDIVSRNKASFSCMFSYMEDDVDISALTIEQYIALIPDDIKPDIVNPKIGDDVEFEINANFMRELSANFSQTPMMKTLMNIYCHPFITAKKLKEICNFKQERDETLYHAWERYNDLLYQFPLHDLNCQQKVHIFYTGLDIPTRKILDSNGFIPLMTVTQALESIQVMADHSHDWYDETTTRERINDVLDNVYAIYENVKREHLAKEYHLKKEDEAIKHSRYMESLEETIIKFYEDTIKK